MRASSKNLRAHAKSEVISGAAEDTQFCTPDFFFRIQPHFRVAAGVALRRTDALPPPGIRSLVDKGKVSG
jgi:hypothetical protein